MTKSIVIAAAVAALSSFSFAAAPQEPNAKPMEDACVNQAMSDNAFEIQSGKWIEQRATDPQVKELAQRLVADHETAQKQLAAACRDMQRGVTAENQLTPEQEAQLKQLQTLQGKDLERTYTFDQVADHEKAILQTEWEADHSQNTQIREYSQRQIPILEEHLKLARAAADEFVPQARQAGERMRGSEANTSTERH